MDEDGTVTIDDGLEVANPPAFQYAELKRKELKAMKAAAAKAGNTTSSNGGDDTATSTIRIVPRQYRHSDDARAVQQRTKVMVGWLFVHS